MSFRRVCIALLAAAVALPIAGIGVALTAVPAGAGVTNYTDPTIVSPMAITRGPDGALWFANGDSTIGRINTAGVVTNYTDPTIDGVSGITTGPDGALWFTNRFNDSIGRITTAGVVTNFTDLTIASPMGITSGPDNALWFTIGGNSIERITTAGVVTKFSDIHNINNPHGITYDGSFLWFTNFSGNSIGRAYHGAGDTMVFSSYTGTGVSGPEDIAVGPDGNVWFTNSNSNSIGRSNRVGSMTNYPSATINVPVGITAGPDGAMWFTNTDDSIGRISVGGAVTNYPDATINSARDIVTGPDGALWYANSGGSSIGRATTAPGAARSVSATQQGSGAAKVSWKSPSLNGGAAVTSYVVTPYLGSVKQPARTFSAAATSQILKGLKNAKQYQFTVVAKNTVGASIASAKTPAIVVGAPSAPGKPSVKKIAAGSLSVKWNVGAANGAPITSQTVTCTSSNHGATKSKTGPKSPITVTGLTVGKTYTCSVQAKNSRGLGSPSAASAAVKA